MNSLMGKLFRLLIQKSIHKMNNTILIFSLESIIKCWFVNCFWKNYTFHKSTLEFWFFFFFSKSRVRASSEVQTQTNCYMYAILPPVISASDLTSKGDVTRVDSQRRFLVQRSVAMLEQCCKHSKQCWNNVATLCCAKNRRCESSRVTSP